MNELKWEIAHTTTDGRSRWEAQAGKYELGVLEWIDKCAWYVTAGGEINPIRGEAETVDAAKELAERHYSEVVEAAEKDAPQ